MSDSEAQLERIFNELSELRKAQVAQGNILVRVDTQLSEHIGGSKPFRDKVEAHDQFITRAKAVGGVFAGLWTLALGWMWKKIVGG